MIRLIQRRLIIPRGDTGSFSIPVLRDSADNIAVFTIFDEVSHTKIFQKKVKSEGGLITIAFTHADTVNLKPGDYVWDIKYYSNPEYIDDELVNGEEIDSYYAGFSLPVCEIRETADNYLVSPDAPTATLSPEQLEIVTGAIHSLNEAIRKTQENVEHYPEIRNEIWYVWDTELGDYVSTNVRANGIVGNGIESAVLNDDYTLTLNFTDGTSFTSPSIRGQRGNGIEDIVLNNDFTLTITYTDGDSYVTPSIRGPVGATPQFSIGTVQEGVVAAASITGTAENPVLNLTLPNAHVPTKVSQLQNDSGYLTQEADPTVPNWAKQPTKPSYTPQEVGALPADTYIPQKTSDLTNDSNYAVDANYVHTDNNYTTAEKNKLSGIAAGAEVNVNADWNANSGDAQILNKPTNVSAFTNDAGYLTSFTETDPTVPAWAKAAQKPSYTAAEVGAPTVAEMNTAIGTAIGQINSFDMAVVQTLPTQNISTHTIYLIPKTGETNDVYDEYVYINNNWEMVGNTQIDLSDYATKDELPDVPVQDVQINGTSILNNGVANVPIAGSDANSLGLVWAGGGGGISVMTTPGNEGKLAISAATSANIKAGTVTSFPIVPAKQHESAFYGLAKAASDTTQSQSNNAVGTYTDEAKAAIQQMLDIPSTNDIPDVPVQDVQINGASILDAQGAANIPVASLNNLGVVKINTSSDNYFGIGINQEGFLYTSPAADTHIKNGIDAYRPICIKRQHATTFYGLAKAAGADMKDIANTTVGIYPDAQKEAIQQMLGISQMLAPTNSNLVAEQAYEIGDIFAANGKLYKATAAIAKDGAIIPGTNCVETTIADESIRDVQVDGTSIINNNIANLPVASSAELGLVKINSNDGIYILSGGRNTLAINRALSDHIKAGASGYRPLAPIGQHESVFYGLSKVAGVDLANENVTLGTYPETSKAAIRTMLGAGTYSKPVAGIPAADLASGVVPVQDVQVNSVSVLSNGIADIPLATTSSVGVIYANPSYGVTIGTSGSLRIYNAEYSNIKDGTNSYRPIVPEKQHSSTFYGLAKAAGVDEKNSELPIGQYTENAKAAIKTMLGVQDGLKVVRLI